MLIPKKTHNLKILPEYFADVVSGNKRFELRKKMTMTAQERRIVEAARKAHEEIVSGASRADAARKKYRNQAVTVDGIRFDSQKEAPAGEVRA